MGGPTEREKMLAGGLYRLDDELIALRKKARRLTRGYNDSTADEEDRRREILRELLGAVGPGAHVEPPFHCNYGHNIRAGSGLYMNFGCVVLDNNVVEIGDNVLFGPGVHVYTAHHPFDPETRAQGYELATPVRVGTDVWVGGGAILCPGVRVGDGSVIGAGSVVASDVPPGVVAAGNPCRVIRKLG
jgi:maltose O-acetyltransferase